MGMVRQASVASPISSRPFFASSCIHAKHIQILCDGQITRRGCQGCCPSYRDVYLDRELRHVGVLWGPQQGHGYLLLPHTVRA